MQTERYIAAADLGSSKVALTIAKIAGEDIQIIYYKEQPSDGIRYSTVIHPRRVAGPLQTLIQDAEAELNIKITQLVVGLPRYEVRQEVASAEMQRTDPESLITREEINALKTDALNTYPVQDVVKEEIYGAVAQSFTADEDYAGVSEADIVGVTAESIKGHFKLLIGARKPVCNLDILFNELGTAIARKMFAPDAVASAVLTETERLNGVALVEVGAGVTSLSIYRGKVLRYFASIPFAGWSITNDIALECGFDERLAENIKLAYGACMPTKLQSLSDKVLQINDEETGSYEQLSLNYLSQIITYRAKEILEAVLFNIQESGFADQLRGGVVLTGGGANLINLSMLLKELSGYKVRIGFPRRQMFSAYGCPGIFEASAGAAVGMVLEARRDLRLNCASDLSIVTASFNDATEEENPIEGELFPSPPTTNGVMVPFGTDTKKPRGKVVRWLDKQAKRAEEAFGRSKLGNLFDQMEEEK